jgi:hypothetical protein
MTTPETEPLVIEVAETIHVTERIVSLHHSRAQANPAQPYPGPVGKRA